MRTKPLLATRVICFALISSIEHDVRSYLVAHANEEPGKFFPDDVLKSARDRHRRDKMSSSSDAATEALLQYCDFGDLEKLIHRHRSRVTAVPNEDLDSLAKRLSSCLPIRNRVTHNRPLEPDDFTSILDLANELVGYDAIETPDTDQTLMLLQERPNDLIQTEIPEFWQEEQQAVLNNLPTPEFEETGFLGRLKDRKAINQHLRGPYPVVSITGVGGVGKSALAQRCLYDVLEDSAPDFDAIVWVSLKTHSLTLGEVRAIDTSIRDLVGAWREITKQFGSTAPHDLSGEQAFDEVLELLGTFKILLALDNCETVPQESLESFLSRIPSGAKILLTSRKPLGSLEFPYPLGELDEKTAQNLMRRYAKALNLESLAGADQATVEKYCARLYSNPLAIKWFVSAAAQGSHMDALIAPRNSSFSTVLHYCFDNLFSQFEPEHHEIVRALRASGRPLSRTELFLLLEEHDNHALDLGLKLLHQCSIVVMYRPHDAKSPSRTFTYGLSDFAREYAKRSDDKGREWTQQLQQRLKALRAGAEESAASREFYKFDKRAIHARDRDEQLVAARLFHALESAKREEWDKAHEQVGEAQELTPNFSEVYRIKGHIYDFSQDYGNAEEAFKDAIRTNPQSHIALYHGAQFLLTKIEAHEEALELTGRLLSELPTDFHVKSLHARVLTRCGRFPDATKEWEELMGRLDEVPHRLKVVTLDQAAECYRRWSEHDRNVSDSVTARKHLSRSLQILSNATGSGIYDRRLLGTMEEVFRETVMAERRYGGLEFRNELESFVWTLPDPAVRALQRSGAWSDYMALFEQPGESQKVADQAQTANTSSVIEAPSTRDTKGSIRSVLWDKQYGFLDADDGSTLFFHRNYLMQSSDWNSLEVGTRVKFSIGSNHLGVCAVNVEPIKKE